MGPVWIMVVGALGLVVYWWLDRPPFNARTLIKIHNGGCFFLGVPLPRHGQLAALEILQEGGVKTGFIAIMANSRVKFSRTIPARLHQRLRNVLLNP